MRYETADFRMLIVNGVYVEVSVTGCRNRDAVMTVEEFAVAVRALKDLERAVRRVSKKYQETAKEPA